MSTFIEQIEAAGLLTDRINAVVKQYDELDASIYQFLMKRSSSKYGSIRGKEPIYKLLVELNKNEWISQQHFDYTVNQLMMLSDQPFGFRPGARKPKGTSGKQLGRGHAQSILAGLLGYGGYRDVEAMARLNNNQIQNLRYGQSAKVVTEAVVQIARSTHKVAAGKKPNENVGKHGFEAAPLMRSKEGMRMGGVLAKDMAWFVRDYGSQFRTPWLDGNRSELRHIAVKRFYGLDDANALAPYLKLRIFPPAFDPRRITTGETQLARHFAKQEMRDKKWTAMTAFLELRPWCATPEIEKELEVTIGALSRGKPQRFAQFFRRKYGVVMLILDHEAGIGLITEKGKITKITRLLPKPGKAPKRERPVRVEYKDRQPEFHEPPRVVLTSHEPAFQAAFRDLNRRRG